MPSVKYALSGSRLRFSKGSTAIPFVTGRLISSLFHMFQPMAAARAIRDAASSALVGLRRTHFLPRLKVPVRRARIGSCFSQCSKRSEEHTSELQSQSNLVCRLLLEKKKK